MTIWFLRIFTVVALVLAVVVDPDQNPWVVTFTGGALGAALAALYLEKR